MDGWTIYQIGHREPLEIPMQTHQMSNVQTVPNHLLKWTLGTIRNTKVNTSDEKRSKQFPTLGTIRNTKSNASDETGTNIS